MLKSYNQPKCPTVIGYAHYFSFGVIWTETSAVPFFDPDLRRMMLSRNHKSKFGDYLGVVRCLIPKDPYRVLYMYFGNSPAHKRFKDRMAKKRIAKKMRAKKKPNERYTRAYERMIKTNSKLSDF